MRLDMLSTTSLGLRTSQSVLRFRSTNFAHASVARSLITATRPKSS